MSAAQTHKDRIIQLLGERTIMRAREFTQEGITATALARVVESGEVLRIGHGLYQLPDGAFDAETSLAEVSKRIPNGRICMTSALAFHGLTDQMPRKVWIAIGAKDWEPKIAYPRIRIVRFRQPYLDYGVNQHIISGVDVPIYSVAKALADAFRNPKLVDRSVAIESLRSAIEQRKASPSEIAQAAINTKVETFVLISTDKAVRPTNVMGATKRLAELVLQGLAKQEHSTRFVMVRFGNVLGSSGSVVPLFKKQIKRGGPITITHPDIIRYFMTIPEAAQLVIQAGAMGTGGDVFVLDMGNPVKIIDLAYKMTHLMGLTIKDETNITGDIAINFSGLRPGEKLFEELLIDDNAKKTQHQRILTANERSLHYNEVAEILAQLKAAMRNEDEATIRQLLIAAPLDYQPAKSKSSIENQTQNLTSNVA